MRKPKIRELGEALRALFGGPYTSRFPKEIPEVPEGFRGKPEYQDECIGCGACAQVCPPGAIEQIDDTEKRIRTLVIHLDRCIFCGQCVRNCTIENGIIQTKQWDLATFDKSTLIEKVERKLVLCEVCGAVISTVDHIRWTAERLGALAYANPTLLLHSLSERGLVEKTAPPARKEDLTRPDRIRITCPRCRRETSVIV